MNPSIRPAIPILYSFFYTTSSSQNIFIFSGSFLYFYYFILVLGIFAFILKKLNFGYARILLGLTLLLSSYYLSNFLIYGFKEIILMFFLLVALLIGYTATAQVTKVTLLWSVLLGVILGLSVYINLSGVIIGVIIGVIYLIELCAGKLRFKTILAHIITVGIFLVLFSAGELKNDITFFRLVKSSNVGQTEINEYGVYKINQEISLADNTAESVPSIDSSSVTEEVVTEEVVTEEVVTEEVVTSPQILDEGFDSNQVILNSELKKQILLKGKFQGFTQVQFYGVIFLLFIIILAIRIVQKNKLTHLEKSILGFFWLWFFVVMDPLFLNTHAQAYVLSISPKYTILLIPLAALFITINYDVLLSKFEKINMRYLLVSSVFILLLVPGIRSVMVPKILLVFSRFIPLYNFPDYYISKIDYLFLQIGILFLVLNVIFCYLLIRRVTSGKKLVVLNFLFVFSLFIFPFLFLLNSNYPIISTFRNIFASKATKLEIRETDVESLSFLKVINYLNNETDPNTKILLFYIRPHMYYIENYHRFLFDTVNNPVDTSGKKYVDVQDAHYIVIRSFELEQYNFSMPVVVEQDFNYLLLLKVLR